MKDFFKNLLNMSRPPEFTGALLDNRPQSVKDNDVKFTEVVGTAAAVNWNKSAYRKFPDLDQHQSNECGAFSARKYLGILYSLLPQYGQYLDFSNGHIYQRRYNRPQAGMMLADVLTIMGQGTTLIALTNEKTNTDADSDNLVIPQWMKAVGEQFATGKPVFINSEFFDTIASVIQVTGKSVIGLGFFLASEWSTEYPRILNPMLSYVDPAALHHFYTFVDYATIGGIQYLVIEDSAHFGGYARRFVTREWVTSRIIQAGYTMNFKFTDSSSSPASTRPSYDGVTIVSAQKCLQYEGLFPSNVAFAENVGPVTRDALLKFQNRYGLVATGRLDAATISKLGSLYP